MPDKVFCGRWVVWVLEKELQNRHTLGDVNSIHKEGVGEMAIRDDRSDLKQATAQFRTC
jgi:hypothetical protein